ncbi:MAG: hypothetical protein JST75_13510 [Bacteroidetes bacterium]|nr:hypothetical protein [Bacteroidota bacterium]
MNRVNFFLILFFLFLQTAANAQQKETPITKSDSIFSTKKVGDTIPRKIDSVKKDSVVKKRHDPHKATLYSAILPGAGQIYNKKYWKLPIVYAAIGIPTYTYFYNKTWYHKCQYALAVAVNISSNGGIITPGTQDSLNAVDPKLQSIASSGNTNALINYRNEFRKDQDYSALFFLIFWGLNIIDATVDAHLKDFNVNDDLSLRVRPTIIPGPGYVSGVSFVFDIHKGKTKLINTD